jgi:GNAT superfamily N-acetyltransferase
MTNADAVGELSRQHDLLNQVFPHAAVSLEYLRWLYEESPDGRNIASDHYESDKLLGHYTVIPQRWRVAGQTKLMAVSLNTAVHPEARGKGLFVQLAEETYKKAAGLGVQALVGVANANSTPGFTRRLGFTQLDSLPVVGGPVLSVRPASVRSHDVSSAFLTSDTFSATVARLEPAGSTHEIEQEWPLEKLRWRLSTPRHRYAVHSSSSGVLITTSAVIALGLRVVVALKFLPNKGIQAMDTTRLLRAAAAHHKSHFFVYSGFNRKAAPKGMSLPRRLLPSPLNLIYRKLDASMPDAAHIRIACFEFLDFDAY